VRRAEGPPQCARERALLTPREPAGLRHGKAAGLDRPSRQRRRTLQSKQHPRDGAGPPCGGPGPTKAGRRLDEPLVPLAPLSRISPLGRTPAQTSTIPGRSRPRRRRSPRASAQDERPRERPGRGLPRGKARIRPDRRATRRLPSHDTDDRRRATGSPKGVRLPTDARDPKRSPSSGAPAAIRNRPPGREGPRSSDAFAYRDEFCRVRAAGATVKLRDRIDFCE